MNLCNRETTKLPNQETKKQRNQEAPLNIPTPTPAPWPLRPNVVFDLLENLVSDYYYTMNFFWIVITTWIFIEILLVALHLGFTIPNGIIWLKKMTMNLNHLFEEDGCG